MLELHAHTTYSDGRLTPAELVQAAIAAQVTALAITDHDTVAGWDEAYAAAGDQLEIVPGVELSTVFNGRSLHILGFYLDRDRFIDPLKERLDGRKRRAQAMAKKLAVLGYPIELPEMGEGMAPGRPHIAAALVAAGHVKTANEAFKRLIGEDGPAYVHYEKFSAQDGIQLLRQCGAVTVWAHPFLFRGGPVAVVLPQLVEAGLQGLEVFHPSHTQQQVTTLQEYCQTYKLLRTGGSDYHGPNDNPRYQLNALQVAGELLPPLKQAALAV
ncbi:MAG: PHP domain-containing protein [Cyanobacteria bacterium P01_H01_bin.121]